jgi:hypothetical protein
MPALNIIDALDDLFHPEFDGPSWNIWRAVLKATYGLPMTKAERAIFRVVADRDPPPGRVKEGWFIAGRRAGKDSVVSAIATYGAAFFEDGDKLRPGERALVVALANDRVQAKIVLGMIKKLVEKVPLISSMVTRETQDGLELSNNVDISVATNDFKSIRGRSILIAILDEVAFYRDENSASPDTELYRAIKPGMMTLPSSMLLGISSPYRRSGLLFDKWRAHFGKASDDTLVIRAPSNVMNTTLSQKDIDAALKEDPAGAMAELMSEWRDDISGFVPAEVVEAAIQRGVFEIAPAGRQCVAWVDPSGGSSDSMTMAIASKEGPKIVVHAIREAVPPFSPAGVVAEFSTLLKSYGCAFVTGDKYAGQWPREAFQTHGISYRVAEFTASDGYLAFLPLLSSGRIELLDHARAISQFKALIRTTSPGGKDTVGHAKGAHDDVANAVAGACVMALRSENVAEFAWTGVALSGSKAARREREEEAARQNQGPCGMPTMFNGGRPPVNQRENA